MCVSASGSGPGYCGGAHLSCNVPKSFWPLITIQDVTKGRVSSRGYDDVVVVAAGSPVSGSGAGLVRLIYGSEIDLSELNNLPETVRQIAFTDLIARPVPSDALGPRSAEIADFNGDGLSDIAVLYGGSEEIRVWLGGGTDAPGEIESRVRLAGEADRCMPITRFAAGDLDGDDRAEIVAACLPDVGDRHIVWLRPAAR
jgi:hypothetical protein